MEELALTPHWKQHKKSGNPVYRSKSLLGEMYSIINDKMQKLNQIIKHGGITLPPGIKEKLNQCKFDDLKKLIELREEMTFEILAYIEEKEKEFPKPITSEEMYNKFYSWKSHYCDQISIKILSNKAFQPIGNAEKAAVLYEQCRRIHAENWKTNATEFAWAVAKSELLKLMTPDGLHIANEKKSAVFS